MALLRGRLAVRTGPGTPYLAGFELFSHFTLGLGYSRASERHAQGISKHILPGSGFVLRFVTSIGLTGWCSLPRLSG